MSVIRITIDFGGARVRIRERLHASIASGKTIVWQEATHESAAWHPCSTSSLAAQLPDARCNSAGMRVHWNCATLGLRAALHQNPAGP